MTRIVIPPEAKVVYGGARTLSGEWDIGQINERIHEVIGHVTSALLEGHDVVISWETVKEAQREAFKEEAPGGAGHEADEDACAPGVGEGEGTAGGVRTAPYDGGDTAASGVDGRGPGSVEEDRGAGEISIPIESAGTKEKGITKKEKRLTTLDRIPSIPMVGFSGRARSGKDTAAWLWLKETGMRKLSFADQVRGEILQLGLVTEEQMVEKDPNTRRILQVWGTEHGRMTVHRDYWVMRWSQEVLRLAARGELGRGVVATDLRFLNEAMYILRCGGWVFYIDAETRLGKRPEQAHASEQDFGRIVEELTGISKFKVIQNNDTLEEFEQVVSEHFMKWRQRAW